MIDRKKLVKKAYSILSSGKFQPSSNYCVKTEEGIKGCALTLLYLAAGGDMHKPFEYLDMKEKLVDNGFSASEQMSIEFVFEDRELRAEDRTMVLSCILDNLYDETGIFLERDNSALQKIKALYLERKSLLPSRHTEGPICEVHDKGGEDEDEEMVTPYQITARYCPGI